jgi:hypothetical protein
MLATVRPYADSERIGGATVLKSHNAEEADHLSHMRPMGNLSSRYQDIKPRAKPDAPTKTAGKRLIAAAKEMRATVRAKAKPPAAPKRAKAKRAGGRPRVEDQANTLAAQRPWEAEGISRRSWFRQRAKTK